MGVVYLVRHGQASFGTDDYDKLSELGVEQSEAVGAELRRRGGEFAQVRCGTMVRQRDTALAAGFDAVEDARWNEYDFLDVLRGQISSGPAPSDPRGFQAALDEALVAWVASPDAGSYGESWRGFCSRINGALDDLVGWLGRGQNAVVFTSGGVIGALAAGAIGEQDRGFFGLHRVTCNAGITKLITGRSGTTLVSFNEHSHFDGETRELLTYR